MTKKDLKIDRKPIIDRLLFRGSMDDLISRFGVTSEAELWRLIRETLLALLSKIDTGWEVTPVKRAIGYLYSLVRFVESCQRFPKNEERELLFEKTWVPEKPQMVVDSEAKALFKHLSKKDLLYQKDPDITIDGLLLRWRKDPKSIKALRLLEERQRKYASGGAESPTETSLRDDYE